MVTGRSEATRVTGATVYGAVDDSEQVTKSYAYDAIGNLVNKSDVSAADYVYGTGNAAGAGDAGPHAVVRAGGDTYAYDDNGNMLSGAGRTLTWTSDNKPRTIATTTTSTTFVYGPDRARIEQRKVQGATTTTIKYVGTVFEQVTTTGEATRYVHYLFAGGERVAIHTEDDAPTPSETLRYLHTDHLGSVDTITDDAGAVVERLSYDAWGKRRTASGTDVWEDPALPIVAEETPRGFTDHEHLDDFALVHMNARVYDPKLGRFLSPDPFIQFPESTQGLNRYTYTLNNPLSFTDPTGYFLSRSFAEGLEGSIGGGDNGDGADPQSSANPASETGTEGSNSHNTAPGHTDDVTPVPSYGHPHVEDDGVPQEEEDPENSKKSDWRDQVKDVDKLDTLSKDFRPKAEEVLKELVERDYELRIIWGKRTKEENEKLVDTGNAIENSKHLTGNALDFVNRDIGYRNELAPEYTGAVEQAAKNAGVIWGGNFEDRYDPNHIELDQE